MTPNTGTQRRPGACGDTDTTVSLDGSVSGPTTSVLNTLTHRQREVVRTAHEMGYHEVPRHVSTVDIVVELDLDQSTVSEHLQRAERNLLGNALGAD